MQTGPGTRPRRRPCRWLLCVVVVGVCLLGLASSGLARADAGQRGGDLELKEFALPERLLLEGTGGGTDVRIIDLTNGLTVQPRTVVADGAGTAVEFPQLARGRFRITVGGQERLLTITDQTGNSRPVGTKPADTGGFPYFPVGLLLVGVGVGALLPGWKRTLGLVPVVLAVVALQQPGTDRDHVLTWGECDAAWKAEKPTEKGYFARRDCHAEYLLHLLEKNDSATIEKTLAGNTNFSLCHDVTQLAGLEYMRKHRIEPSLLARTAVPGCIDGVVHGAVAAWSMYRPDDSFMAEVSGLCAALDTTRSQRSCLHGLGHAALNRSNGDLYEAWELCANAPRIHNHGEVRIIPGYTLPESEYASDDDCRGAAIMDWTNRLNVKRLLSPRIRVAPEREDMSEICPELPDGRIARILCYLATNFREQDPGAAAAFCRESAPNQEDCYAALGHNVARFLTAGGRAGEENLLNHVDACRSGGSASRQACLGAMAAVIKTDPALQPVCRKAAARRPGDVPSCS